MLSGYLPLAPLAPLGVLLRLMLVLGRIELRGVARLGVARLGVALPLRTLRRVEVLRLVGVLVLLREVSPPAGSLRFLPSAITLATAKCIGLSC